MWRLHVVCGMGTGLAHPLPSEGATFFTEDGQACAGLPGVVAIESIGRGVQVWRRNAKAHVFVNGQAVAEQSPLGEGDWLRVPRAILRLERGAPHHTPRPGDATRILPIPCFVDLSVVSLGTVLRMAARKKRSFTLVFEDDRAEVAIERGTVAWVKERGVTATHPVRTLQGWLGRRTSVGFFRGPDDGALGHPLTDVVDLPPVYQGAETTWRLLGLAGPARSCSFMVPIGESRTLGGSRSDADLRVSGDQGGPGSFRVRGTDSALEFESLDPTSELRIDGSLTQNARARQGSVVAFGGSEFSIDLVRTPPLADTALVSFEENAFLHHLLRAYLSRARTGTLEVEALEGHGEVVLHRGAVVGVRIGHEPLSDMTAALRVVLSWSVGRVRAVDRWAPCDAPPLPGHVVETLITEAQANSR